MEFIASSERVIANQRARWCGNLHRISGNPSSYRPFYPAVFRCLSTKSSTSNQEIATPVCGLVRNDREFGFGMTRSDDAANSNLPNCYRSTPSGAGQKRPHISCARLGRPPCGQIPICQFITSSSVGNPGLPHLPHDNGSGNGGVQRFAVGGHGDNQGLFRLQKNFLPDAPALAADDHR